MGHRAPQGARGKAHYYAAENECRYPLENHTNIDVGTQQMREKDRQPIMVFSRSPASAVWGITPGTMGIWFRHNREQCSTHGRKK